MRTHNIWLLVACSPEFVGRGKAVFRQEHGFWFCHSLDVMLTQNNCGD